MPCVAIQIGDARGFACVRGVKPKACAYCGRNATLLCDWPMCADCAQEVDADLHQCREHSAPGLF